MGRMKSTLYQLLIFGYLALSAARNIPDDSRMEDNRIEDFRLEDFAHKTKHGLKDNKMEDFIEGLIVGGGQLSGVQQNGGGLLTPVNHIGGGQFSGVQQNGRSQLIGA